MPVESAIKVEARRNFCLTKYRLRCIDFARAKNLRLKDQTKQDTRSMEIWSIFRNLPFFLFYLFFLFFFHRAYDFITEKIFTDKPTGLHFSKFSSVARINKRSAIFFIFFSYFNFICYFAVLFFTTFLPYRCFDYILRYPVSRKNVTIQLHVSKNRNTQMRQIFYEVSRGFTFVIVRSNLSLFLHSEKM